MHFTNKQALQPARHAAGAQDACAVPHQTFWWGREGLHCPDLQGERRTVQSGSQKHVFLLIPLCGLIFFLVISDAKAGEFISSWIKSMEHLEVGWVGSGFFWRLVYSQTTYHMQQSRRQAVVSTMTGEKYWVLCQVNQNSFAAGMHWYNCACC